MPRCEWPWPVAASAECGREREEARVIQTVGGSNIIKVFLADGINEVGAKAHHD